MAHIHLAWELGGGLGHAGRLRMLALALLARGHRVTLSLRDLMHTHEVLAELDVPKFQAPVWLHRTEGLPTKQVNLAETLFQCGYLEPAALRGTVGGWRALFQQLQPDLLVADFAPTAILAARSLGLRSASVGNGYNSPTPEQPLPPMRAWETIPADRMASSEARVLGTANAVLAELGAPPLRWAAELFLGDQPLMCTWPELDHYGRAEHAVPRWFGPSFMSGGGIAPAWPDGAGPQVFVYLKTAHPLLQALVDEGCRVLAYMPGVAQSVQSPLLHYAAAPVALELAMAEADLCVSHAGEATLAQALLAGVPLLMLPQHTEQFMTARRIAQSGAAYNAALLRPDADWAATLRRVLSQPSYRAAARAFAARHHGFSQLRMNVQLAELLEQQLA